MTADKILLAYQADTGRSFGKLKPARTPLDRMIDVATRFDQGVADLADAEHFVLWVAEHLWGIESCPPRVRAAIEAKKAVP